MIENEKIETQDFRFIYKLILDGWSDSDILNKYIAIKDGGELNIPDSTDISFIKNRRQEMEIACEVLKDSIKKILSIYSPIRRDDHFAKITEISALLLENNINTVIENPSKAVYGLRNKYINSTDYTIVNSNNIPFHLSRLELIEIFRKNVDNAIKLNSLSLFYDCYVPHLNAAMGGEMESTGGFWPEVEKYPCKVVKTIKDMKDGEELKGICPLCNEDKQLPPFIKSIYDEILKD